MVEIPAGVCSREKAESSRCHLKEKATCCLVQPVCDGGAGQGEQDDGGVSQLGLVMKSSKTWQVEESKKSC